MLYRVVGMLYHVVDMLYHVVGMLFVMKKMFNFYIVNPCYTLKTYHNHCSTVHGSWNHSLYDLGWNAVDIHIGEAQPTTLGLKYKLLFRFFPLFVTKD